MSVSVLLIGYGAIASHVARALAGDPDVRIDWVLARPGRESQAEAAVGGAARVVTDLASLDPPPHVALECASHTAVATVAPQVLHSGIDLGIVSIGALAEAGVAERLEEAARAGKARLDVLAGAVGAIDAIAAAREGGLERVVYTSRKPPMSWAGTPAEQHCDLAKLASPVAHFEGNARDAARLYPKNANVAATVALAGLGLDRTAVALVADPAAAGNTHEIEAEGAFGRLAFTITGKALPDNPRSSALTAMSALRFLRNRARALRV